MVPDVLQDKAVQYVSGDMSAPERESFEILLQLHDELRTVVGALSEAVGAVTLAGLTEPVSPSAGLRARILNSVATMPTQVEADALVATDAAGRIQWVNANFTAMCGYSLDELKGRKPGEVLQGRDTDPATVGRIREAVRAGRSCRETIVNYHKDGGAYRAEVRILPIMDEENGRAVYFVARERKLAVA
jgi:PAS domain S-box-containing protein